MSNLAVIILTCNEERHIARALDSVASIASFCLVVDSGSTDETCAIAANYGAAVKMNPWTNYSHQFNWALRQLPSNIEWVLRLDADEIVSEQLASEINRHLFDLDDGIAGVYVGRRMNFLGQPVKFGGLFPIRVIRLFREGVGRCEERWMDEHIIVDGKTGDFDGDIVDDNKRSLTWWIDKHNAYASREVVDILNQEYGFEPQESIGKLTDAREAGVKRWLKEAVYNKCPLGLRALIYFLYRYVIRLGFLDGYQGRSFHVLQGFWYRYLVDQKLREVKRYMLEAKTGPREAIREILSIHIPASENSAK